MMNAANLFAPVFVGIQKSKMENIEKVFQEMDEENDIEEVEEIYELTFGQEEFDNILKNKYDTFAKVAFDTDEEWEHIMIENAKVEPDEEEIVENDEDEFYSDEEILI